MSDYQNYCELQAVMAGLRKTEGLHAIDLPEYQAAWRAAETIKNRNGGMPPAQPEIFHRGDAETRRAA